MGETEGETTAADTRDSEEPEATPAPDTLQVPAQKRRKLKSPTPGSLRGRSATPIRGRSQTPFTLYMTRRSATPSTWRSITPFLKREEKEKTPFELGRDLKTLLISNTAVFDRALVMDISEPMEAQKPVRYITSDMSVIDRAAVMDVSNVEVIYVVEEYEEYEEEEEEVVVEEVKPKKKGKGGKKGRSARKSADKESTSPGGTSENEGGEDGMDREDSVDGDEGDEVAEKGKKGKKKAAPKKKEKKEKSPSPKLTLKLEMGGGQKASKKMFEDKNQQAGPGPKPPPKKSKLALQMEEQAKAAAKAAEEEAAKLAAKPKAETFEERQKRLKAEEEEREREEAERRAQEEAEAEEAEEAEDGGEEGESGGEEHDEFSSRYEEGGESRYDDLDEEHGDEELDELGELPTETRRSSSSSEGFTRPDPDDEERWKQIAEEEGEEFAKQLRKYSIAVRRSEKERDEEWKRRREQKRLPHFVVFLSDRTVEAGHNVRLACAIGGPELSVKWFKDGKQLERDGTHRISNNNNICALEVVNTTILDSGEYSCVIANMNDEVTSSCYVTIYEVFKDQPAPPSFKLVREYYHMRDDELTIEVHIHGVPRPVVTWWRGVFEIKPNVKFTKLEEAHGVYKLLIYKPNNRDSGAYTCKAINSSGEAQISHSIEVGKNLHYHVPGIFHARGRLSRVKENEARKAMEEAMKSKGESDQRRAEAAAAAKSRAPRASPEPKISGKQKLQFATQLRDRMALEGTTVRFVCTVIGPEPNCRWQKDDKWVTYGDNVKNLNEEGKAIIELRNVNAESSGVYKCVARNDYSEIETSCYFKVYSAQTDGDEHEPIFALPLRDVYHSSENDLIIDTKIRGNPRPVITWIKDQLPVVLDDRIVQIEHLDGICELIINKPTPADSGNYTCVAQNKLGTQQTSHSVVVDVMHGSRRSSVLSSIMSEGEGSQKGSKAERAARLPKSEKDEGGHYERRSRMPEPPPRSQLFFDANISNRYVAIGSKVKLQAVVKGPNPTCKWTKDDQNITYGPRIRNMNRDSLASLEFLKCEPEDSGVYTLIAQNEYCKITQSAKLYVYDPKTATETEPVFVRPLKETYHLNTNELVLETGVRGEPTPKIQWLRDNIEIEDGGRFHTFHHADGTLELVLDCPNIKDKGKYMVRAENNAGKAEITHLVHFEGKEHHIADNIHGVFHADKSLLKPKQVEPEKPKGKPAAADSESETESKGKKGRKPRKEDDSETEMASSINVSAAESASETGSLKKREKVIGIYFPTKMKDRVVAEGSKVKISCFLEAKEPQVKWFKNGEPMQNSPKCRGRYNEGLCILEIPNASLEDAGEYRCWARDETGDCETSCRLEVYSDPGTGDIPPTFTRNIKDTYHGKLHELQLDVHVRGLPTPTVTWVKDGVVIEANDKYQQTDHDDGTCELFIMDPTPADSGKYVCQAENREGTAEISHMVTVKTKARRHVSPGKGMPPVKPTGDTETEDDKESASGEGQEGKKKKKKKPDDDESGGGGGRRREAMPPPDLKKQLYFRNFLSNRTVKEGSNVKWMVNIDGPEPAARWFHNDNPIAFGPKSKLSMQDGIAWLQLIGVTEENAGQYTLRVRGPENEIVSTCNLFVYSTGKEELIAPVFSKGIKDTYSLTDNELVLECRVRGKPRPEIQWFKGSEMLIPGDKYVQVDSDDGFSKLIIQNPTEKDSGLYACVARNEAAENKITHQVDFKGRERFAQEQTLGFYHRDPNKPHFLAPLGNQVVCGGGTIAITAEFMQTTTPIEVQWFRQREPLAGKPGVKTFYEKGVYTLAIMNATPEHEGSYTCRAQNAFGRMESHATVDVAVGVEKDERPPLFLSRPDTEMKIAVGDPFSLSFRIAGDPKPKLTFMKGTKDITKSDRVSKEVSDDYTRFTVQKSQISDSGTYFVVARNNNGTDRIFVTVEIKTPKKKD